MSLPSALRAVLFDWDGTLANTAEASFRCYQKLFSAYGIDFDRAAFQRTYSPNWHLTYTALGLHTERWAEADARWLEHYGAEVVALVDGAGEALRRVEQAGLRLGLVTSGDCLRVGRELAALEVAGLFATVVCAEDIVNRKPHPEALRLALDRLRLDPAQAAYVGDSPEDVEMARAAGVWAVGVPGGFPNRDALAASAPDVIAPTVLSAVEGLLARAAG